MTTAAPVKVTPFRAGDPTRSALEPRAAVAAITFTGSYVLMADVSEFQPDVNDAAYLAWSKAIVIRCAYGASHDDHAWYGGQRRALLHSGGAKFIGIYQYLTAFEDPVVQADAFHRIVGKLQPGEVAIADFEEGTHALLSAWYNRMLANGYAAKYLWTYTYPSFGQAQGALPCDWLADYTVPEPTVSPLAPHKLWQFTDAYSVPGVGRADCSVFHGTITQLAALATPAASAAPPANQTGTVTSYTTGGQADVTSSDGGHTMVFGGTVPAGAISWQAGEWTSDQTHGTAYVATNDGGGTWHFAGSKPA